MTRFASGPASRGSQKWLQFAINEKQPILDSEVLECLPEKERRSITWVSPIKSDEYAEYRDNEFLEQLNIKLSHHPLLSFWPRKGPQWDGLAKMEDGKVLLVEAKAHLSEMRSPASRASASSLELIRKSLDEVKSFLGINPEKDWSGTYYQYTNRIAHLYLLRELNQIPAYLIFLYFINDTEMKGPTSKAEWQTSIHELGNYLGLPVQHKLSKYILHVYLDISLLQ
ncbi:MAG: hypothetical protein IPP66_09595 [Anaerolineales bacterium]|nr:hypothetical protein [Anaerolineales bacterium]